MNRTALYLALGAAALYLLTRPRRAMASASAAAPVHDLVPTYTGGSGGVATVRPAVTPAPTEGGAPAVPDRPVAERSPVTNVTVDNSTRDLVRTTMPVPTVTVNRVSGIRRA